MSFRKGNVFSRIFRKGLQPLLPFLLLSLLLAGCGGNSVTTGAESASGVPVIGPGSLPVPETQESFPGTAEASTETEPESRPAGRSLKEYYPAAGEQLYELKLVSLEGRDVPDARIAGDRVLILGFDPLTEDGYQLISVNTADGSIRECFVHGLSTDLHLAENGYVLAVHYGEDRMTLYSPELAPLQEIPFDGSTCFLGADENGFWLASGRTLRKLKGTDGSITEYTLPENINGGSYMKAGGGFRCFVILGEDYETKLLSLRETDGTAAVTAPAYLSFSAGELLYFRGQRSIYYSLPEAPERVYSLPREKNASLIGSCGGKLLLSCEEAVKDAPDAFRNTLELRNPENGGLCGSLDCGISQTEGSLLLLTEGNSGLVLLREYGGDTPRLFLWDTAELPMTGESAEGFRILEQGLAADGESNLSLARAISERTGVGLDFRPEAFEGAVSDYRLEPAEDMLEVREGLEALGELLEAFPADFWKELAGEKRGVSFLLCGSIDPVGEGTISSAGALTNRYGEVIYLIFDLDFLSILQDNFYHELTHAMEHRIEKYAEELDLPLMEYWDRALNSEECPFFYRYVEEDGSLVFDTEGTLDRDPLTAWFVDSYSRSYPTEDRARITEFLSRGNAADFRSPRLEAKARYLTALIRAAFPSLGETGELPWEKLFGIQDFGPYITEIENMKDELLAPVG